MSQSYDIGAGYDLSGNEWEREDLKRIGLRISPIAYRKLLALPQTLKYLLPVIQQPFCHTHMYSFNVLNFSFEKQEDKVKRRKYENHFQDIKKMIAINHKIQKSQIDGELPSEHSFLININILITKRVEDEKADGYCVYYKVEDPETLGTECIVVYYHKILKKCVILISSPKCPITWNATTNHINSTSIQLPFHKDCAFCGRCAENLTKCTNCKVTRYCNKSCQVRHWDDHKSVCKQRKEKLSEHISAQSKLRLLSNHPFIIWKTNLESARAHRMQEMQQLDAPEEDVVQAGHLMSMMSLAGVPHSP